MTVEREAPKRSVLRVTPPWWAWALIGLGAVNLIAVLYVLTFVINLQLALSDISRAAEEGGFFKGMDALEQWLSRLGSYGP